MKDRNLTAPEVFVTIAQFPSCRTPAEVGTLLTAALAGFGLSFYVIGGMPTPTDPTPTSFTIHNWPEEWSRIYFERGYGAVDPVPRVVMTSFMPLTVGEMRAGKAGFVPGPETDQYFDDAARISGGKGLIVPIAGPHGYHGIVVFAGNTEDFTVEDRARLHILAVYAHCRMLDLFGRTQRPTGPQLSLREVDVLRQARAGAGDEAIAQHLGISARTVRFHFENARRKLGVKTRAEALVTAVGMHLLGS
jgi:DNA-binding CsgD family transcriptional regulator